MAASDTIPTLVFQNELDYSVTVYDSFSAQDNNNYFGTLTPLSVVPAQATATVQPLRKTSVLIVSNTAAGTPLARLVDSPLFDNSPFQVAQADVDAMAQTMLFIDFITHNPADELTTAFQALWKSSSSSPIKPVNQFFIQHPAYAKCTFQTYMMGITVAAQQAAQPAGSPPTPLEQATYSLSTLVNLMGGNWPASFPDIVVTKFTCNTQNDTLDILAEIDLDALPAKSDQILKNFGSLFDVKKLQVAVDFHYGFDLNLFGTRLAIGLDVIHVPFGGSASLAINKPTVTIDINPLFKFVVFTIKGSIPFAVFSKTVEADVSMTIDNLEASIGAVIKCDNTSLPAPPVMQGVHFDEFGVGIGVFFEPPAGVLGVQGKLHLGDPTGQNVVQLDDDTFVVVCQLVEEVPNPVYVSFYVPKMDLNEVLTVFTNVKVDLDVPVSFTDLSFKWSENPMEPIVLPDGSLSSMGYGFSGAADILSFGFYGDVAIDMTNGLTADIEMSPLTLKDVFTLAGDGKGVTIKVDQNGNPIKNNQIRDKVALQTILKTATDKQLVLPGGPVLKIQTLASPVLHLNGKVNLFDLENYQIEADIDKDGIKFELDFGGVLASKMSCTLADFHNLAARFQFGINRSLSLPTVGGVSLGSLALQAMADAHLGISTNLTDVVLIVGGGFDFEGVHRSFGDFSADVHIKKVTDLLEAIGKKLEQEAHQLFSDLLGDAAAWTTKVRQGVIVAADRVARTLRDAYGKTADQVASIMQGAGYGLNEIAAELNGIFNPSEVAAALKNTFNLGAHEVAAALRQAGYAANDVAAALKNIFNPSEVAAALKDAFNLPAHDVAVAMQQVGYTINEVASGLKDAFGDLGQVATAIQGAFGESVQQVADILGQIGYTTDQIGNTFKSLGGDFEKFGSKLLESLDPRHW